MAVLAIASVSSSLPAQSTSQDIVLIHQKAGIALRGVGRLAVCIASSGMLGPLKILSRIERLAASASCNTPDPLDDRLRDILAALSGVTYG